MVNAAVAVPCGVLGGLVVVMFAFIWWWFPRTYRKGIAMDMAEVDEARRQRALPSETVHGVPEVTGSADTKPQPKLTYIPPVAGY